MAKAFGRRDVLRAMGAAALLGPGLARAGDEKDVPEQIVDAMNVLFGKHPGFRSAHAKGLVCEGLFAPSPEAATLSKAPHLRDRPVRATIRFSDSTGVPDIPDGVPNAGPRGMAVRFHLPGGGSTDIVANAYNGFAVSNGEDFLAFLKAVAASGKDAPKPTPLEKFLAAHPRAAEVAKASKPVPASFVTEPYFGVNAFEFTNAEGKSRFGRYRLIPEAGAKFLAAEEAAAKPPNFLMDELRDRLARERAKFRLVVQLAAEGDPVDDATEVWPDDRPTVTLGVLSIIGAVADSDSAQKTLAFDPMHLVDGIDASDDPLLELRSAVYAVSRRRRRQ